MICLRRGMVWGLAVVLLCGCEAASTPTTTPVAATPAIAPPTDAAATVMTAAAAMRDGKLEQLYDLLPASYQKDVDGLVQEFASKMDVEVWDATFGTLEKATVLLKTKKAVLLKMLPKQPGQEAQMEQLESRWDGLAAALNQFVTSDLSQLNKLQTGSVRNHVQKGVGPFVKEVLAFGTVPGGGSPLAELEKVKAEVIESSDSTAKVKITSPNREQPEMVDFAKVEGKWIPKSMADDWAKNMSEARENLKNVGGDAMLANKPQILKFVKSLDGVLDQMMTAETPEQIQAAAFPLILQALTMQSQMGAQKEKPKQPVPQVTITVGQDLSEEEQAKLSDVLRDLVDVPADLKTTSAKLDGETTIVVSPVADVAAFAKKLTIAKDAEVDEENRTITVDKLVLE